MECGRVPHLASVTDHYLEVVEVASIGRTEDWLRGGEKKELRAKEVLADREDGGKSSIQLPGNGT